MSDNENARESGDDGRDSREEQQSKVARVKEIRDEIISQLMIPEGEYDGLTSDFHDHLDSAQVALERALNSTDDLFDNTVVSDLEEQEEPQRRESVLRTSKGEICLEWPAGQLLCPNYATWDEDAEGNLKVHVPQGDGHIVTGESAMRMVVGGLKSEHARLLHKRETPFEGRDLDE